MAVDRDLAPCRRERARVGGPLELARHQVRARGGPAARRRVFPFADPVVEPVVEIDERLTLGLQSIQHALRPRGEADLVVGRLAKGEVSTLQHGAGLAGLPVGRDAVGDLRELGLAHVLAEVVEVLDELLAFIRNRGYSVSNIYSQEDMVGEQFDVLCLPLDRQPAQS